MVTRENYFSKENQMKYWGSSQFKAFMTCEEKALAEIRGEHVVEKTTPLLVGGYVDAHFEGSLSLFKAQNPDLFTRTGDLKAAYRQAEEIIHRLERDEMFMRYMDGEKQIIKTGKLFGYDWKIRIDSYHEGKAIVDLKVMRDFEPVYKPELGKVSFIQGWGYDLQGAIYQAIEGNNLPFYIAGATKERDGANIEIFHVADSILADSLKIIEAHIDRFNDVKTGVIEPKRCEKCGYCKATKVLKKVTEYDGSMEE